MVRTKGVWHICEKCGRKSRSYHEVDNKFVCSFCKRRLSNKLPEPVQSRVYRGNVESIKLKEALEKVYTAKAVKSGSGCYTYLPTVLTGIKFKIVPIEEKDL